MRPLTRPGDDSSDQARWVASLIPGDKSGILNGCGPPIREAVNTPLCIDLYCGLGGWAEGFLAEGYDVIGFDIERHRVPKARKQWDATKLPPGNSAPQRWSDRKVQRLSGAGGNQVLDAIDYQDGWDEYPGQLVLQDVLTLDGRQFRNAACIVASPPCQAYSYRAMPWKKAKALPPPDNTLFDACFRIQREASQAAGRYIPMVVENVCGAQKWVGRAKWHYGSYYLWADVPALMPYAFSVAHKFNPDGTNHGQGSWFAVADSKNRGARKVPGFNFHEFEKTGKSGGSFQSAAVRRWFGDYKSRKELGSPELKSISCTSSHSAARKQASALIAKIPFPLAQHIARCFLPDRSEIAC